MADTHLVNASHDTPKLKAAAERKLQNRKPLLFKPRQPFFFELSRLMVVAIKASNGQLVYKAQTKPNGPWQADWTPIDTVHSYGVMADGLTGDGRGAVVGQPAAGAAVLYIDEKPDTATQQWNTPVNLGKPAGNTVFAYLTMAVDADARLEIFGTDTGGNIWWIYQNPNQTVKKQVTITPPGTHTPIVVTVDEIAPPATPWSNWIQIPGGLSQIRALRNADGRLILFGINSGGHLYRDEQKAARALLVGDWYGWVQMDNNVSGTFIAMAPTLDSTGAINLFGINNGNQILQAYQSPPCTLTWSGWTTPGYIREGVQALAVGLDGDSELVLVATDSSMFHNVNNQLSAELQQWSGWNAFAATGHPVQLALDYNADGRLTLFSHWLLSGGQFGGLCRRLRDTDLPFLERLYAASRMDELAPVPWPAEAKQAFLAQQFRAQHAHYQQHYPTSDWLVILRADATIGRLYVARWEREHRVIDIALLPEHQRQGLGSALMRDLLDEAAAAGQAVSVHVEKNNPAMGLYRRLGFVTAEDKGVYDLMRCEPPVRLQARLS